LNTTARTGRSIDVKRTALLIIGLLVFAGCDDRKAESTVSASNKDYKVEKLFTDDNGCAVYRFSDDGRYRYYVVGPGAKSTASTYTTGGKHKTTHDDSIPTLEK
jgi:hypothetical protein